MKKQTQIILAAPYWDWKIQEADYLDTPQGQVDFKGQTSGKFALKSVFAFQDTPQNRVKANEYNEMVKQLKELTQKMQDKRNSMEQFRHV